jgi:hypothetical protein
MSVVATPSPDPAEAGFQANRFKAEFLEKDPSFGLSTDEILQGKFNDDPKRRLLISIKTQYWQDSQVYGFALFAISVAYFVPALLYFVLGDNELSEAYLWGVFLLCFGSARILAFFVPKGNKYCEPKLSDHRQGGVCLEDMDCTLTNRAQPGACRHVPPSFVLSVTTMLQFVSFFVGIVMVVQFKESSSTTVTKAAAGALGFGLGFMVDYIF